VVHPDLDERLLGLWQQYGQTLLVVVCLVLVFYLGRAGWEYYQAQQEAGVRQEYAAAALPEQLKSFVAAHPTHPLAGVAELQLADEAYAAGRAADAVADYSQAAGILKGGPLAARAQLGLAMAQIQSGQAAEGQAGLQALADDAHQLTVVRAEATYQLASLAASAGHPDEVQKRATQLLQLDPSSPWTQRAFSLQAAAAPAAGSAAPAGISFKPGGQ
jgi:predicted negative regulator of RcsB-dependent stress response